MRRMIPRPFGGRAKIRIFISHKDVHRARALDMAERLESAATGGLECFVSGRDIYPGDDWRERIRSELNRSNMLLLLYTEPTEDWSWCLYEAGLYTRLDRVRESPPVVCLYRGAYRPGPLQNIQGVQVDNRSSLVGFLETLFRTDRYFVRAARKLKLPRRALQPGISPEEIERLAEAIEAQFRPSSVKHPGYRVLLNFRPDSDSNGLAREAIVTSDEKTLNNVFGRSEAEHTHTTWGELVDSLERGDRPVRWCRELNEAYTLSRAHRSIGSITTTFRGYDGRLYIPEIYEIRRRGDGSMLVILVFDVLDGPSVVGDEVFNLIRVNFRVRDEVLSPFAGQLAARIRDHGEHMSADQAKALVFRNLVEALRLIEHEAESHGFFDDAKLAKAFGDNRERLEDLTADRKRWRSLRAKLEDIGRREDVPEAEGILDEMRHLNWRFSIAASESHQAWLDRQRPVPV